MERERIYIWICFFFCLGLAAGGVLIFFREKSIRSFRPVLLLQYFLILIYAYGFYSIWSVIFYRLVFGSQSGTETGGGVPSFLSLLGLPFLLAGLVMLVLWAVKFSVKKVPVIVYSGGFLMSAVVVFLFFLWQDFNRAQDIQRLYALIWITIILLAGIFLSLSGVRLLGTEKKMVLILLLLISGAVQVPEFMMDNSRLYQPAFAFLFFLANTSFCLYFVYAVKPHLREEEESPLLNLDSFFEKYGITPRESEVIMEIYSGKTNQQIADTLFVSLQTIKDHTHRIYQKTNIKNRTLLSAELRKYQE